MKPTVSCHPGLVIFSSMIVKRCSIITMEMLIERALPGSSPAGSRNSYGLHWTSLLSETAQWPLASHSEEKN
jgi:hypothetical protein